MNLNRVIPKQRGRCDTDRLVVPPNSVIAASRAAAGGASKFALLENCVINRYVPPSQKSLNSKIRLKIITLFFTTARQFYTGTTQVRGAVRRGTAGGELATLAI